MTMREIRVTEDRAQAARDLLTHWATFPRRLAYVETLSEQDVLESPHIALGTVDEIVTQLEYQREHWGLSYLQIGFADREASAPVLARLARQPAIPAR